MEERYRIGINIKEIRKSKKLTLKALAEKSNISISYLSDIERNRSNPSLERLYDIAKGLDVSISVLLGENTTFYQLPSNYHVKEDSNFLIPNNRMNYLINLLENINNWDDKDFEELVNYLKVKNLLYENR